METSQQVAPPNHGIARENHRYGCWDETLPISNEVAGIVWHHQGNHYDHPRHRHSALEMNLVVSGRGCYEVDGRRHPLVAGSVMWIRPGEPHYVEERSCDFEMWIVAAEEALLERSVSQAVLAEQAKRGLSRVLPADELRWLEREIRRTYERGTADFLRVGIAYVLLGAWDATSQTTESAPGTVLSAPLHKALALLDQDASLSREALADSVGTTPERLGRLFQSELGIGFVACRNRLRLSRFLEIQRTGRGTLLGACYEAGFGSYAQFHRVFTEVVGAPPSRSHRTVQEH